MLARPGQNDAMPPRRPLRSSGPVRRPTARWYLLSVFGVLLAVPLALAGVVGLAWQTWTSPDPSTDRATLTAGTRYDLYGAYGGYGDIWTVLAVGDNVTCRFTPAAGGAGFDATYRVPEQHEPKHVSRVAAVRRSQRATVGEFTAPRSGSFRIRCIDDSRAGSAFRAQATRAPSGWPPVVLVVGVGLFVAALVWIVVMVRMRSRSRLLHAAVEVGAEIVGG